MVRKPGATQPRQVNATLEHSQKRLAMAPYTTLKGKKPSTWLSSLQNCDVNKTDKAAL